MGLIASRTKAASSGSGQHVVGAFVVDPNNVTGNASNSNNGILVADGGTGAWLTFAAAMTAQGGFSVGNIIAPHDGTVIEMMGFDVMTAGYDFTAGGSVDTGYTGDKIIVRAYPGYERLSGFDCVGNTSTLIASMLNGDGPMKLHTANWRFEDLRFKTDYQMFTVDGEGNHFIRCLQLDDSDDTTSNDNTGVLAVKGASNRSAGFHMDECVFYGHERTGLNAAGFYIRQCENFWIRRSILMNRGGGPGHYYKHSQLVMPGPGDCIYEYCLFSNRSTGRGGWYGMCNGSEFSHCIFDTSSGGGSYGGDDGGADGAGNNTNNTFEYCTFPGAFSNIRDGNNGVNGQDNTIRNSIIGGQLTIWNNLSGTHNTTLNYNAYGANIHEFTTARNLSQWQTYYGQDANSVAGSPTFVATTDPTDPSTYALAGGSVGENAAENGQDMGAAAALVGPQTWSGW